VPAPVPAAPKAAVPASSGSALGKVSGTASGGKILQKEEVSADVLNMLKVSSRKQFESINLSVLCGLF
jgi:hypothetical protein